MEGSGADREQIGLPTPSTFAPLTVDAEGWVKALASFGVTRAVLVVSHGCGFNTFPSRTAFPEFAFEYNYSVKHSPWKNGTGDIARDFVTACAKYGIRPGFYHGAMNNAFLNVRSGKVASSWIPGQAIITQDQYTKILLANLRQLWTDYGPLAEVCDGVWYGCSLRWACLGQEWQCTAVDKSAPPIWYSTQRAETYCEGNTIQYTGHYKYSGFHALRTCGRNIMLCGKYFIPLNV